MVYLMKRNLLFILVFLLVLFPVYAVDFTPSGNINGRGIYTIYNFTNITANGYLIGNGAYITGIVASYTPISNYSNYSNQSSYLTQYSNIINGRPTSLYNFTNDPSFINLSTGQSLNDSLAINSVNSSLNQEINDRSTNDSLKVDKSFTITTTGPLFGTSNLTSNFTIYMTQSNGIVGGYLSAVDYNTFNGKGTSNLTMSQVVSGVGNYSADSSDIAHNISDLQSSNTSTNLRIDSIGNWTNDKPSYTTTANLVGAVGNYSADRSNILVNISNLNNSLTIETNSRTGNDSLKGNLAGNQIWTGYNNFTQDAYFSGTVYFVNVNSTMVNATNINATTVNATGNINGAVLFESGVSISSKYNYTTSINNNISAINTSNNILQLYAQGQRDPQGFNDTDSNTANTHSTLWFNDSTRTFSITPNGTSYTYYIKGNLITVTTTKQINISNTTGAHIISFDSTGNLVEESSLSFSTLCDKVNVAVVYWDAPQNKRQMMDDERHTHFMECNVHQYLHEHLGTQYDNGLAPNITVGGSTAQNTSAQFSTSAGSITDEDYTHNIAAYNFPGNYRVYYQIGSTGNWSWKQDSYPFIYSGDATGYTGANGRAAYNLNTAGVWSLSQMANNGIVLVHVFSTNSFNGTTDMVVVEGQATYGTAALATTGATTEINNIRTAGLFSAEYKPLYTMLVQTTTAGTNLPHATLIAPSTGGQFIDWRTSNINGATGTNVGGTVMLVDSGTGLTGGPITSSGTLSLDTTYTDARYLMSSTIVASVGNYSADRSNIMANISNLNTSLTNEISARTSIGNYTNDRASIIANITNLNTSKLNLAGGTMTSGACINSSSGGFLCFT